MIQPETPRHSPLSQRPVCCGHRGFKSKFPENTLLSFKSAVSEANVRIIETDIQVSKDGVVLINHDAGTERIYGQNYTINETNYDPELKALKNLSEPHEPILTLNKALQWLMKENSEVGNVKFMLDIKGGNSLDVIDKIIEQLLLVENEIEYWHDKIIFGIWTLNMYEYGAENHFFDGFEIVNITISMTIANLLLSKSLEYEKDPNFKAPLGGISIIQFATWNANNDEKFIKFYENLVNKFGRKLYLWTCNDVKLCEFYYDLGISGFLTDIPDKLNEMMDSRESDRPLNLYEFYRFNDPVNFYTKQGLKNFAIYKVYQGFEMALLKGYMGVKVPIIGGGKKTVASYSMIILKLLGIV